MKKRVVKLNPQERYRRGRGTRDNAFEVGQDVPGYGRVVSLEMRIPDPLIEFSLKGHRIYAHEADVLYVLLTERG